MQESENWTLVVVGEGERGQFWWPAVNDSPEICLSNVELNDQIAQSHDGIKNLSMMMEGGAPLSSFFHTIFQFKSKRHRILSPSVILSPLVSFLHRNRSTWAPIPKWTFFAVRVRHWAALQSCNSIHVFGSRPRMEDVVQYDRYSKGRGDLISERTKRKIGIFCAFYSHKRAASQYPMQ